MARFPKMAEGVKPLWDAMDKGQRDADLTQAGTIYRRALEGDLDGAIGMMEQRVQADLAAKTPDAADQAILAGLRSEDPVERKAAISSIGIYLATAAGADKFGENYSRYFPTDEVTPLQRKVDYYRKIGRNDLAEQVLENEATDLVVGQPGAPIMTKQQAIRFAQGEGTSRPEGREPSRVEPSQPVSDGSAIVQGLFPEARITQVRRDPNSALGRANPSSYHNRTAAAVDVAPIPGMTFDQFIGRIRDAGHSIIESRDEVANPSSHATGPHWHVVIGRRSDAPVKVRSIQQARRLPAGTLIETPDGRTMRLR